MKLNSEEFKKEELVIVAIFPAYGFEFKNNIPAILLAFEVSFDLQCLTN